MSEVKKRQMMSEEQNDQNAACFLSRHLLRLLNVHTEVLISSSVPAGLLRLRASPG